MLTTTRRGWCLALESALAAFAVVVCGSVSLLANSHASAPDSRHRCDTPDSNLWTAAVSSPDSSDDGDDDGDDGDDLGVASLAAPIILTSDSGPDAPVVATEFDVLLILRSERLSSRGPPDGAVPSCVTADADSSDDNIDDDDDDDDDDDGDSSDLGSSSTASDRGQTWVLILSEFDALISFVSNDHSLRAPPQ